MNAACLVLVALAFPRGRLTRIYDVYCEVSRTVFLPRRVFWVVGVLVTPCFVRAYAYRTHAQCTT